MDTTTPRQPTAAIQLQDGFDPLVADQTHPVQTLRLANRREVRFIDLGEPGWRTIVFFGGLGTSVGAFELTEFARTTREKLKLRVVTVERNGFGQTRFDPSLGYADAADDVLAVLAELGIGRVAIVAFSGGGPYAAALAARVPERVLSLHLAAAAAGATVAVCGSASSRFGDPATLARDPQAMWEFPGESPVHRIPGFVRAAAAEGFRALAPDERGATALAHDWRLLSSEPLPDLSAVVAPAYLYWGTDDGIVPPAHVREWRRALPNVVALRSYPGEAHDVQYRHWDQILIDIAGLGARKLVCRDGRTWLAPAPDAAAHVAAGATLGLCAWAPEPQARET